MSTERGARDGDSVRVPLSAIYRQLDDHLGPDEEPYDVETGLERLVSWMSEDRPESQVGSSTERVEAERLVRDRELIRLQATVIERTATLRMRSSRIATGTVAFFCLLTGLGLLYGLRFVPVHAVVATVVTMGIIDALTAFAVGYIHRTTMKTLRGDVQTAFGTRAKPRQRRSREGEDTLRSDRRSSAVPSRIELVPNKTRFTFLSVLAAIVAGASTAALWLPPTTSSWLPLTVAGVVIGLLVTPLIAVIIPATWSRSAMRRDSAQRVLYAILGLTMRIETPHEPAKLKEKKRNGNGEQEHAVLRSD